MRHLTTSSLMRPAASVLALGLALAAPATGLAQLDPGFDAPRDFSAIAQAKLPSVVGIIASAPTPAAPQMQRPMGPEDFFGLPRPDAGPARPRQALGSGFIISPDGYVVTNNHVIEGATEIQIVTDGDRRIDADLVGTDPATDIALLKVAGAQDLPAVNWGASRALEVGDWVVAIGNPFGLGGTVTAGIVSAQSRNINSGPYDDFIQTDAAINSGNSGGPLFDAQGKVIGVNTAIFSPSGGNVGIGFAVPAHVAQRIVADLREDGVVTRGWLGVRIQPVSDALVDALGLEDTSGALINDVAPDGPAGAAGLRARDVVLSVDGQAIADPQDLVFSVADLQVGATVPVTLWRDGSETQITVEIGRQPGQVTQAAQTDQRPAENPTPRLGASIAVLTPELRSQLDLPGSVEGLAVMGVSVPSPAADAGLARGDVIVSAGGEAISEIADMRTVLDAAHEEGRPALLRLYRDGAYMFLAVALDGEADG